MRLRSVGVNTGDERALRRRATRAFGRRLAVARAIIGYDGEDEFRVRLTHELVAARADELATAVYGHLMKFPETASFFQLAHGSRDREHIGRRIDSLTEWLASMDGPLDEDAAARLIDIGRAHTARAGDPALRVHARYLLMTISFVQTAVVNLLAEHIEDLRELAMTAAAWNKLLMIHLDLFLAACDGAGASGHWY
jgi:hypothetical protein